MPYVSFVAGWAKDGRLSVGGGGSLVAWGVVHLLYQ